MHTLPSVSARQRFAVTEAGWYLDPRDANRLRYWDGGRWTTSTAGSTEATRQASASRPGATATTTEPTTTRSSSARSSSGTVAVAGTQAAPVPAEVGRDPRWRLAYVSGAAVIVIAVIAGGVAILGRGGHSKIEPVPHADRAFLSAVHADLPQETTSDSRLLAFGRLVCRAYAGHDSPTERSRALDRPDLVSSTASRNRLLGEALNHLCPQFQLSGIQPLPAAPGATRPTPTVTTAPEPSISVSGP